MDYITEVMRAHFPGHVAQPGWQASETPFDGRPVEWSAEKYATELAAMKEKGRKRRAGEPV